MTSQPHIRNRRIRRIAAVSLAALLGLLALGGGIAGSLALTATDSSSPLSSAVADEIEAGRRLDAPHPGPRDLALAEAAARRALAQSPTSAVAWLELARIDRMRGGRLGRAGMASLQRSYDFEPLGPEVSRWRMSFAFENWEALTPELRRSVLGEFEALWAGADSHWSLSELAKHVANPSGRVAALLTVRRMELSVPSPG